MDQRVRRTGFALQVVACLVLVACSQGERNEELAREGLEYAKQLVDHLVDEQSLDPNLLYLVSFSSVDEAEQAFVPVVIPLTRDIEPLFTGHLDPYEVDGYRFVIWDIDRQDHIHWKSDSSRDANGEHGSAVVIATMNGGEFPRNHFGHAYTTRELSFRMSMLVDLSWVVAEKTGTITSESGPINVHGARGQYYFSQELTREGAEEKDSETLIAYIDFGRTTVAIVYFGPKRLRSTEEAEATRDALLKALEGAFLL